MAYRALSDGYELKSQSAADDDHPVATKTSRRSSQERLTDNTSTTLHRRGAKPRKWTSNVVDTWTLEILWSVFALGCLMAIMAVLLSYQGKPAPSLPFNMTLNTLISIIATGAKSSTIAVIASSLGQAKWIHLRTGTRPLSHIQLFDDASFGPLGSFWLLFSKAVLSLPATGALLIIFALPYDPFIQQLIDFSQPNPTEVLTSRANAFYSTETPLRISAISNAIYGNVDYFGRRPSCPTGNCTWESFESLGWCSKCEDMTSKINTDDCTFAFDSLSGLDPQKEYTGKCAISLGKGNSVPLEWSASFSETSSSGSNPWMFSIDNEAIWTIALATDFPGPSDNATYLTVPWPQLVLGYLRMDFKDSNAPERGMSLSRATQCALSYCVTTDSVHVSGGGLYQQNRTNPNFGVPFFNTASRPCWTADPIAAVNGGKANHFQNVTVFARSRSLLQGSESTYSIDPSHFTFCRDNPSSRTPETSIGAFGTEIARAVTGTSLIVGRFGSSSLDSDVKNVSANDGGEAFSFIINYDRDIEPFAQRVAAAYTDLALNRERAVNTTSDVKGEMYENERLVRVRWGWGALPLGIWVGSVLFLVGVAVKSRRLGLEVWKGATLVYLFSGLENEDARETRGDEVGGRWKQGGSKMSDMEDIAKWTDVRLVGERGGKQRIVAVRDGNG